MKTLSFSTKGDAIKTPKISTHRRYTWQVVMVLLTSFLSLACESTDELSSPQTRAKYDEAYYSSYKDKTRSTTVYDNFKTRVTVNATLLSRAFNNQLQERLGKMYETQEIGLTEQVTGTGFFVTIYASNGDFLDLSNEDNWNVFIEKSGTKEKPFKIEKINNKSKWKAFFPSVNKWTEEYLVLFNSPNQIDENLSTPESIQLVLASPDSKIKLAWNSEGAN